jgi:hypothetical protein
MVSMVSENTHAKASHGGADTGDATVSLSPVGGANQLPETGAPTPPIKGDPVAPAARKGLRVLQGETDVAENAARELRDSTTFDTLVNPNLGTAEQIANALLFAVAWYREAKAGATWAVYSQAQSNLAWAYTLAMIERLRATFQAVAATDPTIEKEMPNFTQLLNVRKGVAQKGVVTKKKIARGEIVVNKPAKASRKGATASSAATASAPAEATASPSAPAATGAAPAAVGTTAGH